jgi:hypothetical protein
MRVLTRILVVCVGVACTRVVFSAPGPDPGALYKRAAQLDHDGEYGKALAVIDQGLAFAPTDIPLLRLKGTILLNLRDYPGALIAYQAYLGAGVKGRNRIEAQRIVDNLLAVKSTSLEITLANGPATIYLDSRAYGALCTAAPSCTQAILPGAYKVIAVRPGFKPGTDFITVPKGMATKLAITLIEKPSPLIVRVTPSDARVMIDDAPYDPSVAVAAGTHQVVVSLAGHVEARREVAAHVGRPIELDIALEPLVPIRVDPPSAELHLDGKPVAIRDGGIEIPRGAHVLEVRARGYRDHRIKIPAARGAHYMLAVALAHLEIPQVREDRFLTRQRKLALVAGGAGAAAMLSGVVLGLRARQLEDRGYKLCPSMTAPCPDAQQAIELNHRAQSRALQANIAYGVTGVAAVAAAVLWLTGAPESRIAITPQLGGVAGLDLSGRF